MSSLISKSIAILALFAGVSKSFEKKIKTGQDNISAKLPRLGQKSEIKCIKKYLQGHSVYSFEPKNHNPKKCILYFHGGAYLTNFSIFHWNFLKDMVKQTGYSVIAPDYPLSPKYCYKDVFSMIFPLYKECLKTYGDKNVIVMGDSAGGGLALAIAQLAKKQGEKTPLQIILLSPWLNLTCKNPLIEKIEKKDPILRKSTLIRAANIYADGENLNNHLLSPINGDLHDIGKISLFTGTYDILNADAKELQTKCYNKGVEINFVEFEKMIHIWMIIGISSEAKQTRKQIYSLLKTN